MNDTLITYSTVKAITYSTVKTKYTACQFCWAVCLS